MSDLAGKDLTLYHYWRSSSSWRVRWALEIKKIKPEMVHLNLLNGETETPEHLARHPLGYVPVLKVGHRHLIESVAIIEWLDSYSPGPALFPGDSYDKAQIRTLVEIVNADTQPIQNLPVLDMVSETDDEARKKWAAHFIKRGLSAYEKVCKTSHGQYSVGNQVTAADLFLIPQCYNALRFGVDLSEFPIISKIHKNALATPEGQASHPDKYQIHSK